MVISERSTTDPLEEDTIYMVDVAVYFGVMRNCVTHPASSAPMRNAAMIHTILLDLWSWGDPENAGVVDDRLGMNLSKSCIRLSIGNARWIYENIPTNTRLVVYE